MKRREFITLLGGAAVSAARGMGAQRPSIFGWFTRSAETVAAVRSYDRQEKAPASLKDGA